MGSAISRQLGPLCPRNNLSKNVCLSVVFWSDTIGPCRSTQLSMILQTCSGVTELKCILPTRSLRPVGRKRWCNLS